LIFFCSWLRIFSLFFLFFFLNFALGPLAARYPSYGGCRASRIARGRFLCLPSRFAGPRRTSGTLARPSPTAPCRSYRVAGTHEWISARSRKRRLFQREQTTAQIRKKKGWTNQRKIKQRRRVIKCSKAASSHYLTKCNTAVLTLCSGDNSASGLPGFSRLDLGQDTRTRRSRSG